jgi:hypothetical protein
LDDYEPDTAAPSSAVPGTGAEILAVVIERSPGRDPGAALLMPRIPPPQLNTTVLSRGFGLTRA